MFARNYQYHKVASAAGEIEFKPNHITNVEAGGKIICIATFQGALYAFSSKCPHASGRMGDGFIDALGNAVCPVHHFRFSIKNGRNTTGEGYLLKTFPVEIREDGVYVGIEEEISI